MAELMSLDIVRPAQPVPVARPGYSTEALQRERNWAKRGGR